MKLAFISSNAQDLIITTNGDSISCKITKVKAQYIDFAHREENEIKSTLIPTTEVSEYFKDIDNIHVINSRDIPGNDFNELRLAFDLEYGCRIGKLSDELSDQLKDYTKKLRAGFTLNAKGSVYLDQNWGIGLKYSFNKTKNSKNTVSLHSTTGYSGRYDISDEISIHYVGPSFHFRSISLNKKSTFICAVSAGYVGYKNLSKIGQYYNSTIIGQTAGFSFGIFYDHTVSQHVAIGIELALLTSV